MAILVQRDCRATPEALLEAIRQQADAGEPNVPEPLRRGGITGIKVRTGRNSFGVRLRWNPWYNEGDTLELRGSVTAAPGGGSLVVARAGRTRAMLPFVIFFGALALAIAGTAAAVAWTLLGILLMGVLAIRWQDARVTRDRDIEAAYLLERLEAAISRAENESTHDLVRRR